ncbi:skin calcitonin gene-related peptide isoform X2 [Denticeps clupeoides]|nr:islet amyloid polypeptide isoform X2 [Denticeps clupeoides]
MNTKPPAFLVVLLLTLRCAATAPSNRDLSPASEETDEPPDQERWMQTRMEGWTHPFLSLVGGRPQRALTAPIRHHIEKRKCNTATCVTQRLADFLVRSSNTIGTVYAPTNVGSSTYGKRNLLQPPILLPL